MASSADSSVVTSASRIGRIASLPPSGRVTVPTATTGTATPVAATATAHTAATADSWACGGHPPPSQVPDLIDVDALSSPATDSTTVAILRRMRSEHHEWPTVSGKPEQGAAE